MQCLECKKETDNPKFCSRRCFSIYYNKLKPRRIKTKRCKICGELIYSRHVYCSNCRDTGKDITLKDAIYKHLHKSSAFALVRSRARYTYRNKKTCEVCGYSKHVEVCHIKPISEFDESTLLSVINSESNIKILCPNCHWEFDNSESSSLSRGT